MALADGIVQVLQTSRSTPSAASTGTRTISVASWNLHAGVDGWARPFAVVDACGQLDADVLVLQECWTPREGQGLAEQVAKAYGYHRTEAPMGRGRMGAPARAPRARWGPVVAASGANRPVFIDGPGSLPTRVARSERYQHGQGGWVSHAVLTRLPVVGEEVVALGRLPRDRVRRSAIVVEMSVGSQRLRVVGTHMSHLSAGSPIQFRRLRRELRRVGAVEASVVAGDMNLWGPPVRMLLRHGRRRAVIGATWPAWRPHSQIDHVLVTADLEVVASEILPDAGSDHRPVRVRLAMAP